MFCFTIILILLLKRCTRHIPKHLKFLFNKCFWPQPNHPNIWTPLSPFSPIFYTENICFVAFEQVLHICYFNNSSIRLAKKKNTYKIYLRLIPLKDRLKVDELAYAEWDRNMRRAVAELKNVEMLVHWIQSLTKIFFSWKNFWLQHDLLTNSKLTGNC